MDLMDSSQTVIIPDKFHSMIELDRRRKEWKKEWPTILSKKMYRT